MPKRPFHFLLLGIFGKLLSRAHPVYTLRKRLNDIPLGQQIKRFLDRARFIGKEERVERGRKFRRSRLEGKKSDGLLVLYDSPLLRVPSYLFWPRREES